MSRVVTAPPENHAARVLDLSVIRYSRVWEDYELLLGGLGPIRAGRDVVLSIASSGDNVLNLLLAGPPKAIIAFDMSPAQIAFCRLKIAAARALPRHHDFVWFLGIVNYRGNIDDGKTSEEREEGVIEGPGGGVVLASTRREWPPLSVQFHSSQPPVALSRPEPCERYG